MAKKRDTERKEEKALSRRDFVTSGAAAGIGAAVLSGPALAQPSSPGAQAIQWNYEADVVVLGSGCVGLHAAGIAAAGPRLAAATPYRNGIGPRPIPIAWD